MQEYIYPFVELLNGMSPYLLLGFLIAGLLHSFVPRGLYTRLLAGNDMRAVVLAALFGVPLPLCSCGVIPTAMSMRREGASHAATVSFLIATPQTGVDSILATASLLGIPFAILRPLTALVTALFGGGLVAMFSRGEDTAPSSTTTERALPHGFVARLAEALRYGFVEMMQDIGRWLVVGLVLAGLITIFVPDNFFALWSDRPVLNMLLVLAISAPMYLCATGSIPIAAALMLKGLSPGAAFVLLMAGPATNMAAMLVIGKVLGRRTLMLYLAAIIAGAVGCGIAIDTLMPAAWFSDIMATHGASCCGASTPWWQWLASGVLAALLVAAWILRIRKTEKQKCNMQKTYQIKGMNCNHCRAAAEKAIAAVEGVTAVTVELASATAQVEGSASPEAIIKAVEEVGFECKAE